MTDRPICCGKPMTSRGSRAQSGRRRWRCNVCNTSTTAASPDEYDQRLGPGYDEDAVAANNARVRRLVKAKHRRWVITSAQNNTRLHVGWQALKNYCRETGAELLVIPVHHKNVSLYTAGQEYRKTWPADAQEHLVDDHLHLGGGVEVAAELKIAATAARPLSALQGLGGRRWQIVGHSKQLMEPVATPSDMPPKRLYTTGSCTVRNYSKTKAGALADFHHTTGALVVEVASRSRAFVRQLAVSGDSFFDVAHGRLMEYGPDWVKEHDRVLALTTGDEHVKFHDARVYAATYGPEGMATVLRPEHLFRHDILDGYARSHHHEKDPVLQFRKFHTGDDDYEAELNEVVEFLNRSTPPGSVNYIVDSNHHDHLRQWLNRADVNKDHRNALLIANLQARLREDALAGRNRTALEVFCEGRLAAETVWLDRNKPFLLKGVDYSQHGDIGVNGARGSAASIAKTTHKTVIGHSHTARIVDGCYQVGHSAGDLEYAKGMGTWTHTHCIQYPNGKRTLVDIWRGEWHG
jgi:hypothetical protein